MKRLKRLRGLAALRRASASVRVPLVERVEPRRLLAAASLDATFGSPSTPGMIRYANSGVDAAAVLSDGRTVAASESPDPYGGTVIRLNAYKTNGYADTTFGNGGSVVLQSQYRAVWVKQIVELSDGDIAVAIENDDSPAGGPRSEVLRFNPDGTRDTLFGPGVGGRVEVPGYFGLLAADRAGGLVVAGGVDPYGVVPDSQTRVRRLGRDGTWADDFGTASGTIDGDLAGYATVPDPAGSLNTEWYDLDVLPDGSAVLSGGAWNGPGARALAKLRPDGKGMDVAFGSGGLVTAKGTYAIKQLLPLPDGRLLAGAHNQFVVFNADGTPATMPGAGPDGLNVPVLADGRIVSVAGLAADAAGRVIYGGVATGNWYAESGPAFAVGRLDATLKPDATFNNAKPIAYAFPPTFSSGVEHAMLMLGVQPSGRIVAGGHVTEADGVSLSRWLGTIGLVGGPAATDTTPPQAAGPLTLATVNGSHQFKVRFSEAIDVASLAGILKVRNQSLAKSFPASDFEISYDAANFEATFTYTRGLLPAGDTRVRIPPEVRDLASNVMQLGIAADLVIPPPGGSGGGGGGGGGGGSSDTTPPKAGALTVAVVGGKHQLSLTFDEAINPNSLAGLLKVRNKTTGVTYENQHFTLAYDAATFRVTFTFNGLLPRGDYRARLAPGVRDLAGNATTVGYALDFAVA